MILRLWTGFVTVSVGLTVAIGEAIGAEEATDVKNAMFELAMTNASPNGGAVRILLRTRDGKFTEGLATGYNGLAHDVDASKATLEGSAIKGDITVTYTFDGYLPPGGKPLPCAYKVDAQIADGKIAGTFEAQGADAVSVKEEPKSGGAAPPWAARQSAAAGKEQPKRPAGQVTGTVQRQPVFDGYWTLALHLENGAGSDAFTKGGWGIRVFPKLILKDGKPVLAFVCGHGGRAQINYFEAAVTEQDLKFGPTRLAGSLTAETTDKDKDSGEAVAYKFVFNGKVVGKELGGTFTKRMNGKECPGGPFRGTLAPMPAQTPENAFYYLELHGAVAHRNQLMAMIPRPNGKFGDAMAYSGKWNHTYHDVDASGLVAEGDALKGELKVTMNPDPYIPADRKPVPARYLIDARIKDGRIVTGTYTGMFKDDKVAGALLGELSGLVNVPEPVNVNVKLDDGVCNGAPWFRRVYVGFKAVNGKADTGGISNNKHGWTGKFKKAEVKFEGTRFSATIDGSVDESGSVKTGNYTFKLTGRVLSDELVGTCDTYLEGQLMKTNTAFMGGFSGR